MNCWLTYIALVAACVLSCEPTRAQVSDGNPQGQLAADCSPPAFREHPMRPEVTVAELIFEGDLLLPVSDQDEITASLRQRTYWGEADAAASEVEERVRQAWQNHGYFKVEAHADGHLLSNSPTSRRIAVTVHIDEGQQYRLDGIRFRRNRAISNVHALRNLFPIKDGDVFDRVAIAKGLENLRLAYGEFGYVNFTAVPETQFHDERQTISMNIDVDEGKQFYVSSISLLGPDDNMLRDSPLQPGNIYNQRLARLFIQEHAPYSLGDASPDSRIHLQLNERAGTLVITFDLRGCPGEEP